MTNKQRIGKTLQVMGIRMMWAGVLGLVYMMVCAPPTNPYIFWLVPRLSLGAMLLGPILTTIGVVIYKGPAWISLGLSRLDWPESNRK